MKKYTLKRILTSLFTLLAILLVLFILMQLMPGSPFNDEKLTADMRAALYAKYGLDQPIYIQFFRYVGNMLRGDLGVSYNISKNTPISQLIQSPPAHLDSNRRHGCYAGRSGGPCAGHCGCPQAGYHF